MVTTSIAKTPAFQDNGGIDELSDFLSSSEGLETLSATGNKETVSIVDKRQTSDGVFLQLLDTDAILSQNVWKSFLNRSDHLVTVTLLQSKNASLTSEQAMQFLQSYSESIQVNSEQIAAQSIEQIQPNDVQSSHLENPT